MYYPCMLRVSIADMILLNVRTKGLKHSELPTALYQGMPEMAMTLIATIPSGTFAVSIPGENGVRHLIRLGGSEHEYVVTGGFLEGLEETVEGICTQSVCLVNDIDLISPLHGKISDRLPEFPNIIDTRVGRSIYFHDINELARINGCAACADTAGFPIIQLYAVYRFGEYTGYGGFPHASRAGEKIGMGNTIVAHGVQYRGDDVRLTDYLIKSLGPPSSGYNGVIAHK